MKKALFVLIVIPVFLACLLGLTYSFSAHASSGGHGVIAKRKVPERIVIANIGVDAAIEAVGLDEKGNMDVPADNRDAAWYNLGYALGEDGNTVIDGHYDTKTGSPAVFFHLSKLEKGNRIQLYSGEKVFNYIVAGVNHYPYKNVPLYELFGAYPINRLILITCYGTFNPARKTYSDRTVVFAYPVEERQ